MQRFRESENGAILEYITNQRFAENHCALSAEDLGVRERVRRVRLNWTVHVPVSRSLQGNGAEKRNSERFVKGSLEEDSHKRDGGRCLREGLDEGTYKRDGGRCLREGLEKMSIKERWEGGKVCAECRDFGSQRTGCFRIKFNTNQLVDSCVL